MNSVIRKGLRKRPSGLPLGISHREFVRTLNQADRMEVFSRFTDRFWRESSRMVKGKGLAGNLKFRLELAKQVVARRSADAAILSSTDKLEYLFRRGFFADRWSLYKLGSGNAEHYLSDLQNLLLFRANTIYHPVLDNRLLFGHAFSQYFPIPQVHAFRNESEGSVAFSSHWEALSRGEPDTPPLSVSVRPLVASARGRTAVFTIHDRSYSGSGKSGSLAQLDSVVRDWAKAAHSPYVFVESIQQGSFTEELHPESVNVVHVLMSRNDEDWAPRMDAAVLRVGRGRSGPLGRIENGGLSALIDIESGTITRCIAVDGAQEPASVRGHPDTGAPIVDRQVPGWNDLKARLLDLFDQSSYLRIAAFDLVLQDNGAVLVGGTNLPDIVAIQMHKPLLADRGFAQFLRKQKI